MVGSQRGRRQMIIQDIDKNVDRDTRKMIQKGL
jgi:hypothetical protein